VRESALYNYFKSKEALFDALILAHEHSKSQRLASLAGDGPIADAHALLERLALSSIESFLDPREQMLFRLLMSDGIRLARSGRFNLHERLGSGPERMQELMRRLMREGWLRKGDPKLLWMRHIHAAGGDPGALKDPRVFARQHVEQFFLGAGALPSPRTAASRSARTRIAKPSRRRVTAKRQSS